ncbi:LysR family transcriptional regulator [Vibrio hannami]|uniref:LysR family transcriptional regulator n=1 Tax=Vibrio hannami TaxID=2717094 RepID=UPI00240EB9C7|nr:LysR family transcriptional regulator [Vibrio hannami]MDG3086180.1 LysR family transcriptional regulator [Vibrio hannami]
MANNITLKQLNVFVSVTQHQTLTKASEHLFLSKAAVSMALSELEKQLGHTLFDRVNNRLILNQEGRKLLPLADEIVSRSQNIGELFSGNSELSGTLNIGASDTLGNQLLPYILSEYRAKTGHLEQDVFISNTAEICQKLVDYELDIALIEGEALHPGLIASPFSQDEMCVICPTNHALAGKKVGNLYELEDQNWILREPGSGTREFFLTHVATHLENWHEAFRLNTTEALINSVSAGLGLSCISKLAASAAISAQRIQKIDIPVSMERQFWLLIHKEKYRSPLINSFIHHCEKWAE